MTRIDVDAVPVALLVVDARGRLVEANAAATDLLGPLDDVIGQEVADRLGLVVDTIADEREVTLWRRTGSDSSPAGHQPTGDGTGEGLAVMAAMRATAEGGAVVCLRPADDAGIAVISTVAHELRSPLTSVKGYVSLMLNRWDRIDDDRKRVMLGQVENDADRVTRLITELLDISRLEAGRLVLRRQSIDLATLAQTVVDKVTLAYPDLDCTVDFADVPPVYADPDKIEQVLTNLVENAAKYADPAGVRITGTTAREEAEGAGGAGHVVVSVHDTGEGIPESDLPKVFTRFFRRDHGRPTGTGLGLWISRGLVEAHDGSLVATSSVGVGSTFTFTLPIGAFEDIHG